MKTLILSSSQSIQIFPGEDLLKTGTPSRLAYNPSSRIPNSGPRTSHFQRSKDSCNPLQQSRIHFPRQQSRFYYLRLSRIHLSSARQLISLHAHSLHSYHKHWYNIYCIIHFMQHNFVFQLIFYPFQDKINKLQLQLLKTVYGRFPTWMLIYCLFNSKTSENSLRILQTRMSIYCLFRPPV